MNRGNFYCLHKHFCRFLKNCEACSDEYRICFVNDSATLNHQKPVLFKISKHAHWADGSWLEFSLLIWEKISILDVIIISLPFFNFWRKLILDANLPIELSNFIYKLTFTSIKAKCCLQGCGARASGRAEHFAWSRNST